MHASASGAGLGASATALAALEGRSVGGTTRNHLLTAVHSASGAGARSGASATALATLKVSRTARHRGSLGSRATRDSRSGLGSRRSRGLTTVHASASGAGLGASATTLATLKGCSVGSAASNLLAAVHSASGAGAGSGASATLLAALESSGVGRRRGTTRHGNLRSGRSDRSGATEQGILLCTAIQQFGLTPVEDTSRLLSDRVCHSWSVVVNDSSLQRFDYYMGNTHDRNASRSQRIKLGVHIDGNDLGLGKTTSTQNLRNLVVLRDHVVAMRAPRAVQQGNRIVGDFTPRHDANGRSKVHLFGVGNTPFHP